MEQSGSAASAAREESWGHAKPSDQAGLGRSPGPGAACSPGTFLPPIQCRLCQYFKTICSAFTFSIVHENAIPFG